MTKDELIDRLTSSREAMLETLDGLSDEQYLASVVSGERSVKDLLAHLTIWEAQLITLLFRAGAGNKPNTAHFARETRAEVNARWASQHKDRPLEKVLEDFEGIRNQTIRRLEDLSDADLNNPTRYPWQKGRPIWEWVLEDTVDHETFHRDEIAEWFVR
jgi:hypothetical protein